MMNPGRYDFTLEVHVEAPDDYWAEVVELPGCFASGASMDELEESLEEAISLYLSDEQHAVKVQMTSMSEPETVTRVEHRRMLAEA